jgi:hypothetical protein
MGVLGELWRSPLQRNLSYLVAVFLDFEFHDICFPVFFFPPKSSHVREF